MPVDAIEHTGSLVEVSAERIIPLLQRRAVAMTLVVRVR